ncbi:hypothetical protein P4493_05810 [Bacillus thuringiensis]|jgi:hypothetical protein|uniref:Uncharacterized protein n=3 Tax=Bacillus thuringiensis TaxID=1428 RepID=A0A0B5NCP6_BACTU|nr:MULTISPECIES: hypothetical protein [Bacillus]MEC2533078.1 hypothetical protein [Bacillus cereus]MED1153942.1 hypothetical protein [Bacillus paranthracis]OUB09218.1 hypothetical protein BK708_32295 [Bacillus thuringiensis serovar yunnanensis]AFQ29814.1 hypothetical protein BTF1_28567 [Bacillus thuringiensis HD-789]AJG74135.1 hypothetical protein BF38_6058 [Bacillus thuringiensis]
MKITLNYNRTIKGMELVGGRVTHQDELLFFTNHKPVLDKFLEVADIAVSGVPTVEVQGDVVSLTTSLDREFIYKPYMSTEKLPLGLERVMVHIDNVSVEGYMEVQGKNIIVHHPSRELGQKKLEKLDEELMSGDLLGMIQFHIPSLVNA